MKRHVSGLLIVAALVALVLGMGPDMAQATGRVSLSDVPASVITYQGRLLDGGRPANGLYDFLFQLYDQIEGGSAVGPLVQVDALSVVNGLFTAQLDFGAGVFQGMALYLEISVRPTGSANPPALLTPRQPLTAAPLAFYAQVVPWGGLLDVPAGFADGVDNDTQYDAGAGLALNAGQFSLRPSYQLPQTCRNGQVAKWDGQGWLCGDDEAGSGPYWRLEGNAGTMAGAHFLGTTDSVSLTLAVHGAAALRLYPNAASPSVVGGWAGNAVQDDAYGVTIGGGGQAPYGNRVAGDFGVIAGGDANSVVEDLGTVGGGGQNQALASYATVAGGHANSVSGFYGVIAGGESNQIIGHYATIGGGYDNEVSGEYGVIAGGGRSNPQDAASINRVTDNYGVIGGGGNNQAGNKNAAPLDAAYATVGGGENNQATAGYATIAGGQGNRAAGYADVIGGGLNNVAENEQTVVAGGQNNRATGARAAVAGGNGNEASGARAAVGGGESNLARNLFATVAGGQGNLADGPWSAVAGGHGNQALAESTTIAGGSCTNPADWRTCNRATDRYGVIGGGGDNQAGNDNVSVTDAQYATVAGGVGNVAGNQFATVGGGWSNQATADGSVIAGGVGNFATGLNATVAGGNDNRAAGERATVLGGHDNTADGDFAMVAGGSSNFATGDYSFAAGRQAWANNQGCFVWADNSTLSPVICSSDYRWTARASGGVYFYTNAGMTMGVRVPAGGGSWSSVSDANLKENFAPADGRATLEQLARLPIASWNYVAQDETVRHLGPTAQDFYAVFGLGEDNTSIATVDADGVALAAMQGLYQVTQAQAEQIARLETEKAGLETQLAEQGQQLTDLEARLTRLETGAQESGRPTGSLVWFVLGGALLAGVLVAPRGFGRRQAAANKGAGPIKEAGAGDALRLRVTRFP